MDYNQRRQHKRSKGILHVSLSIHCIKKTEITTRKILVRVEDISLGGLCFESDLNFPSEGEFILKLEHILFWSDVRLYCVENKRE